MNLDNTLANFIFKKNLEGGDTGKRVMKHRSFALLWFTHNNV